MAKSDYSYKLEELEKSWFILIQDLNKGRMSVTNNIEEVIDEICQKERINPVEHFIVYRDSDGTWDGFEFATGQFIHLGKRTGVGAMAEMLKKVREVD